MQVRVHKNRSLDRANRPCRCWLILTPQDVNSRILATTEDLLLRDATFRSSIDGKWTAGWAFGTLVWTRTAELWPTRPDVPEFRIEDFERNPELLESPADGWERIRFVTGLGFGIGKDRMRAQDAIVQRVPWLLLTPELDGTIRPL